MITKQDSPDGIEIWTGWLDDDENWEEFEKEAEEYFDEPQIVDVYDHIMGNI